MARKLSIIIALMIFVLNSVKSQTSVDYLTGTANVNIPVCSAKGTSMDFPVSLSYNTGGIKVNEVASWVGLGWNLNAGGAVSREIHGLPDEMRSKKGYLIANDRYVQQDFIGEYYLGAEGCQGVITSPVQSIVYNELTTQEKSLIANGEMDLEPDIFEVSAPGLSCRFSFGIDDQRTPSVFNSCYYTPIQQNSLAIDYDPIICYPKQDVKITYERDFDNITSFTIQNLDGYKYVFNSVQRIETSFRLESGPESNRFGYNVSWYITAIYAPNGDLEAEFTYSQNSNASRINYYEETKAVSSIGEITYSGDMDAANAQDPFNGIGPCIIDNNYSHSLMITTINWKRLSSIRTKYQTIEFEQGEEREDLPGDYFLKRVHSKNSEGLLLGTVEFHYKYATSSSAWPRHEEYDVPADFKRLMLQEILRLDHQGDLIENSTQFSYGLPLPPRNSFAQDHWGYFNQVANEALVCEYDLLTPWISIGPNREAGGWGAELQSIHLPNGGVQSFEYERRSYGRYRNNCYEVHGLPDQLDVTLVEGDLAHQCYDNLQGGSLIFSESFQVEVPQKVKIEYSFQKLNFTVIPDCENLNNYKMIHIRIREPESNNYIFDRVIPSDGMEFSGRELFEMEFGTYVLEIFFEYYGRLDHDTHVECLLSSYDYHFSGYSEELYSGGLRLKSLKTSDGDADSSNDMITTFSYTNQHATSDCSYSASSGVLLSLPKYELTSYDLVNRRTTLNHWSIIHTLNEDGWMNAAYDCVYKINTSGSVNPLITEKGAFVLYSNVIVRNGNGEMGYSVYQYDINDLPDTDEFQSSITNTLTWQNTALRRQLNFNSLNQLYSSTEYEYVTSDNQASVCYQVRKLGQHGQTVHESIDIDHEALREVQKKSVINAAKSLVGLCLSGGNTFSMATTAATVALDVFLIMRATLLLAQNNDAEFNEVSNSTTEELISNYYYLRTQSFKLHSIKSSEYDVDNSSVNHSSVQVLHNYRHNSIPTFIETYQTPDYPNSHFGHRIKLNSDYELSFEGNSGQNCTMYEALRRLRMNGVKSLPIEEIYTTIDNLGQEFVIGGVIHEYGIDGARVLPVRTWKWETTKPYPYNYFSWSVCSPAEFSFDKPYRLVSEVTDYSDSGVPITFNQPNGINYSVCLEGTQDRAIAVVQNARAKEFLYTSFEEDVAPGFTYSNTSCLSSEIAHNGLQIPLAKTGLRYLEFSDSGLSLLLMPGSYELSFWAKGDSITLSAEGSSITVISVDFEDALGWKLYRYNVVSGGSSAVEITFRTLGTVKVDEVRYHPRNALMRTISYNQEGTIHSVCDENSYCSYFGYDAAHRKIWSMDNEYNFRESMVYPSWNETCEGNSYTHRTALHENAQFNSLFNAPKNSLDFVTDLSFVDGLGRPLQSLKLKQSPSGKDIVSQLFYDDQGRNTRSYLPFTRNYSGECFIDNFIADQNAFYRNCPQIAHTDFPYSEVAYEQTSRDRVIEQGSVGYEWQLGNHTRKQEISLSRFSDNVIQWRCTINNPMNNQLDEYYYKVDGGANNSINYWGDGALQKIIETDENGKLAYKFYDHSGRLVLSRLIANAFGTNQMTTDLTMGFSNSISLNPQNPTEYTVDTYYVYDEFGRLKFELTPEFVQTILNSPELKFSDNPNVQANFDLYFNLCYSYVYDCRGNLTEKHLPETKNLYLVYDDLNNLVMTQDARQRAAGEWSLLKNDVFGRPLYTAKVQLNIVRQELQHKFYKEASGQDWPPNGNYNCYETTLQNGVFPNIYSSVNGPAEVNSSIVEILNINYYDSVETPQALADFTYHGNENLAHRLKGYKTGSSTKVLNPSSSAFANSYIHEISYFNAMGRLVETQSQTIAGGTVRGEFEQNWLGQLQTAKKFIKLNSSTPELKIENRYQYDRLGRPLAVYQKTNDDPMVQLVGIQYNELGQVYRKHLHLAAGENRGMQVVDYRYNERGWLTKINNSNLVDDGDNLEDDDVFGMNLLYYKGENEIWNKYNLASVNPESFYGGQLAGITWNTKKPNDDGTQIAEQTYVYRYDDLYRLTCSAYAQESFNFNSYGQFVKEVNSFMEKTDYDLNGSILKMSRNRLASDHAFSMDEIKYEYLPGSYRLHSTQDGAYADDVNNFVHYENYGGELIGHYTYDVIGNCISDSHKRMTYSYNALGLLASATPQGSTTCYFIYDATGQKLAKRNGNRTTYYLGGVEYESINGQISFVQASTGVGVVRPNNHETNPTEFIYDYFLTDHKGNVRAIVTEGDAEVRDELATMEISNSSSESEAFNYIDFSRKAVSLAYPATLETGQFLSELSSGTTSQGPSHLSEVMAFDNIQVSVQSWFNAGDENSAQSSINQIVASILADLTLQSPGVVGSELASSFADPSSNVSTGIFDFVNSVLGDGTNMDMTVPQGYLVYFFLDENLNIDPNFSGAIQVQNTNELQLLQSSAMVMPAHGYFYTYLTNFSDQTVYFDNLSVRHKRGVVRGKYDYYTYGLMWGEVESAQHNYTLGKTELNAKEWGEHGLDMNWYSARWYDPVLGRWHSPDPLEQFHSPYLAMCNDPANFVDPDGRSGIPVLNSLKIKEELQMVGKTVAVWASYARILIGNAVSGGFQTLGTALGGISSVVTLASSVNQVISQAQNGVAKDYGGAKLGGQHGFVAPHSTNGLSYHGSLASQMGLDNKPWVRRADGTFGYYVSDNSSYDYSKEGTVLGENFTYSADNGDMVELQPGGSWSSSASNETHQVGVNFIAASHIYVDHSADWLAFSEQARALRKLMDKTLVEVAIWVGPSLVFAPSTVILRGAAMYDVVACEVATCAAERQAVVVVGEAAAGSGANLLKPLGLGSTGRTVAANLAEELAMKEIMSNPSIGRIIIEGIKDTRWVDWVKMAWNNAGVEIHYVAKFENGVLIAVDDFKFINQALR